MNEKKTTGVVQQRFCLLLLSYTECEKGYLTFKTKYKKQQKNDWGKRLTKIIEIKKKLPRLTKQNSVLKYIY